MKRFSDQFAFNVYSQSICHGSQFFPTDAQLEFAAVVKETAHQYVKPVQTGTECFRVQAGCDWEPSEPFLGFRRDAVAFSKARMTPDPAMVRGGRANGVGKAVFYCASDPKTAVAESRVTMKQIFTLATCITRGDLSVIDFTQAQKRSHMTPHLVEGLDPDEFAKEQVWASMGNAFTLPVTPEQSSLHYLPSQSIAELLNKLGYDGIKYRSSFTGADNFAFFKPSEAIAIDNTALGSISRVCIEYEMGEYNDSGFLESC